jgi:hypothetical protein
MNPTSARQIDESQSRVRIVHAAEVRRRLGDDHFERRPHASTQEMAAMCRSVGLADDDMRVHLRLITGARDVPEKREHFDLLGNRNLPVILCPAIEYPSVTVLNAPMAESDAAEIACARANSSNRACRSSFLSNTSTNVLSPSRSASRVDLTGATQDADALR